MEYRSTQTKSGQQIKLSGIINEDSEIPLEKILNELVPGEPVTFNFSGIKSINSLGVRAWVNFMRKVSEKCPTLFEECVPEVIMQINMIPSFRGTAEVRSFFVNYVSDATEKSFRVLVETNSLPSKTLPIPPLCPDTGEPMETEELEDEYFAFLMR